MLHSPIYWSSCSAYHVCYMFYVEMWYGTVNPMMGCTVLYKRNTVSLLFSLTNDIILVVRLLRLLLLTHWHMYYSVAQTLTAAGMSNRHCGRQHVFSYSAAASACSTTSTEYSVSCFLVYYVMLASCLISILRYATVKFSNVLGVCVREKPTSLIIILCISCLFSCSALQLCHVCCAIFARLLTESVVTIRRQCTRANHLTAGDLTATSVLAHSGRYFYYTPSDKEFRCTASSTVSLPLVLLVLLHIALVLVVLLVLSPRVTPP